MGIILLKNSREKLLDFLVKKNRGSGWQYNGDREKADFLNSCFGLSLPVNWEEALKADRCRWGGRKRALPPVQEANPGTQRTCSLECRWTWNHVSNLGEMWGGHNMLGAYSKIFERKGKGILLSVTKQLCWYWSFSDWIIRCITCKWFILYLLRASKNSLKNKSCLSHLIVLMGLLVW